MTAEMGSSPLRPSPPLARRVKMLYLVFRYPRHFKFVAPARRELASKTRGSGGGLGAGIINTGSFDYESHQHRGLRAAFGFIASRRHFGGPSQPVGSDRAFPAQRPDLHSLTAISDQAAACAGATYPLSHRQSDHEHLPITTTDSGRRDRHHPIFHRCSIPAAEGE